VALHREVGQSLYLISLFAVLDGAALGLGVLVVRLLG
jgi:hypothetical protein